MKAQKIVACSDHLCHVFITTDNKPTSFYEKNATNKYRRAFLKTKHQTWSITEWTKNK